MSYFIEVWLRNVQREYVQRISKGSPKPFYPHITLVRPFDILDELKEEREALVQDMIVSVCRGFTNVKYTLMDIGNFDGEVDYIYVEPSEKLIELNNTLEFGLEGLVSFREKKNDKKIFHVSLDGGYDKSQSIVYVEDRVSRITVLKDKKIWFSYDFITSNVLDRDESLRKKDF